MGEGDDALSLPPGGYVSVMVFDTGNGIAKEVMARVYDPFFSTKLQGEGTGLGLSMVYGFVKQSGGEVVLESVVGQGTHVELLLPRTTLAQTKSVR